MNARGELRRLTENHRKFLQLTIVRGQPATPDRGAGAPIVTAFGVGQVNQTIVSEIRRQRDIEQAALALGIHLGHTLDGRGHCPLIADQTQPPRPFGH